MPAFLRRMPNPWLGLTVAFPYLIVVVSMGYTRQGVAIGLVMWGLAALDRGKFLRFLFFVTAAVTFHKSAILMIAFAVFQRGRGRFLKLLAVGLALAGVWFAFVDAQAEYLWVNYVEAQMKSQGAMIRAVLNFLPALLLFSFRKRWKALYDDYGFWRMIAWAAIASLVLVKFASTAVDRMALYFIPLQIVVYARLPYLVKGKLSPRMVTTLVVLMYLAIMTVWLTMAANARYWVHYHNILTVDF